MEIGEKEHIYELLSARLRFIVSRVTAIAPHLQISTEKVLSCVIGLLIFNTGRAQGINNPDEKELLSTANVNEREKRADSIVNNLASFEIQC